MVLINEWLPNPDGSDTAGEFIELWNNGDAPVNLSGWSLAASNGKKFVVQNETISGNSFLVLYRSETKLVLKNTDEEILLYDTHGQLVDQSRLYGTAESGKSLSRAGERFHFADPTPSTVNNEPQLEASLIKSLYPLNQPLNGGLNSVDFITLLLGCAAALTAFTFFVIKKNEDLSRIFFGRDGEIR
jgi:hypothetical protein